MAGKLSVGYHFVIDREGNVENGRSMTTVGQHTPGQNTYSLGICLIGGLSPDKKPQDNYTPAQYAALRVLITTLRERSPAAAVVGHNHFNPSTACPCFDVKGWASQ